jgi:flagellin-like protein
MGVKRGISAIVASVLLILITIAGVAIIWGVILPMISDIGGASSENSISIDTAGGYTLYDDIQGIACVQIKKESSIALEGLRVLFNIEGNSYSSQINKEDVPALNQKKTYCFSLKNFGRPSSVTVVALPEDKNVAVTSIVSLSRLNVQALGSILGDEEGSPSQLRYLEGDGLYYYDSDGDGFGNSLNYSRFNVGVVPAKFVSLAGDCDDLNSGVSPNVSEVMSNGVDENCDGFANLNSCGNLNVAGAYYRLDNDTTTTGNCFNITASGLTLDGNGKRVVGDGGASDYGIITPVNSNLENVTIKNFGNIGTFNRGMSLDKVSNWLIYNNTLRSQVSQNTYAIYIKNGEANRIESNVLDWNATGGYYYPVGIHLDIDSGKVGGGNVILENTFLIHSQTTNSYGILLDSDGVSDSNIIQSNNMYITGVASIFGVYLNNYGNSSYNLLQSNNMNVISSSSNGFGIYSVNYGNSVAKSNVIQSNVINSTSLAAETTQGISISAYSGARVNSTVIQSNNISIHTLARGFGLYLYNQNDLVANYYTIQFNFACDVSGNPMDNFYCSGNNSISGSGNYFKPTVTPCRGWPTLGAGYNAC